MVINTKNIQYKNKHFSVLQIHTNNCIEIKVFSQEWSVSLYEEVQQNIISNKQNYVWYIDDSQILKNNVLIFVYHGEEALGISDIFLNFLNVAFPGYSKGNKI